VAPQKVVQSGDVLVNSTGVGTLGRVGVLLEQHDALTVDSHVTIVRPQNASSQPWFGLQMLQRQTELEAMGVGSTGQTELGRQAIGQLTVLKPTSATLNRFADRVWPLLQPVSVLLGQSRILASFRDHLLPRLVTGQIDVSSINFDTVVESVA
jgi:type I restriction enzyme S subunit